MIASRFSSFASLWDKLSKTWLTECMLKRLASKAKANLYLSQNFLTCSLANIKQIWHIT